MILAIYGRLQMILAINKRLQMILAINGRLQVNHCYGLADGGKQMNYCCRCKSTDESLLQMDF